jgi:hypothetical protein
VTPALGPLLITCVLLAAPVQSDNPAAQAEATLQKVAKLAPDHQRVWLRLIEQRYGWAALLTLKPEDARLEQDRVAKLLRQKTVAWNELSTLLRHLDQREKLAISRLVRQYRSEVYETFQKRPRELMDRQDAWYRIWSLWEKAGSPPEQQDRLMDWLADAIRASGKDAIGPLPADPKFGDGVELVPEQLVRKLTQPPPEARRPPPDDFAPMPEAQARSPLPLGVPDSRQVLGPSKEAASAGVVRRAEDAARSGLVAEAMAGAPPTVAWPPAHAFQPVAADDPADMTAPPAPPHPALAVAVQRQALRAAEGPVETAARAESRAAMPPSLGAGRQLSEAPPARIVDSPLPERPAAGPGPISAGSRNVARAEIEAD